MGKDLSKRNSLAGKHPSYKARGMSEEAIKRKRAYDSAYGSKSALIKYRTQLNRKNHEDGTYGNKDGKDVAHTKNGLVHQSQSYNRAGNKQRKGKKPSASRRKDRR